jgi:hypothetical protein
MKKLIFASAAVVLTGCAAMRSSVFVTSQTGLGVAVAENPATQLYEARFGYFRNEFAYVPGNTNDPASLPDVMMELRIVNIFSGGGIYQRLCVGKNAVQQPGAYLMFSKDSKGNLLTNAVQAINGFMLKAPNR